MRDGTKPGAGGGRPREYDPDTALGSALAVFWRKGFASSSLDELARAAGMNRPSLHAAFGDKKALYLAAIERFGQDMRDQAGAALDNPRLEDALRSYFAAAIEMYLSDPSHPKGCFVVCTAATEAPNDPDIRAALGATLDEIDRGFETRLEQAQRAGDLAPGADAAALARLLGACLHSLAVRARAGQPRANLEALSSSMVEMVRPAS